MYPTERDCDEDERYPRRRGASDNHRAIHVPPRAAFALSPPQFDDPSSSTTTRAEDEPETSSPSLKSDTSTTSTEDEGDDEEKPDLQMGDHVFIWCSLGGIPRVFQHHAIVMSIYFRDDIIDDNNEKGDDNERNGWFMKVADFSNLEEGDTPHSIPASSWVGPSRKFTWSSPVSPADGEEGCLRTYETSVKGWYKVQYDTSFWKRSLRRPGTCTGVGCDPPALVRARMQFLLEDPTSRLPSTFHAVFANCECVAVWCKTGTWSTVQGVSMLQTVVAGHAKSTVAIGSAAAVTTTAVTAPSAGVWGVLGYTTTTQVSLLAAQPWLLPAIAVYGTVSVGVPAVTLLRAQKKWKMWSEELNKQFWESSVDRSDLFVDLISSSKK